MKNKKLVLTTALAMERKSLNQSQRQTKNLNRKSALLYLHQLWISEVSRQTLLTSCPVQKKKSQSLSQ